MNIDAKAICLELLHSDDENDVINILKKHGLWDAAEIWRDFGDNDNNYSTVGAQQSDPIAALVEKLVNSADAMLMSECAAASINPESDEAPKSVREAVAQFIEKSPKPSNETAGRIENWTDTERRENAKRITLAATGSRSRPCLSIADLGEGQTPSRVPQTFMSLNKSNKLRTPFVQGKFNMGGTGVFRFCGKKSLQLVVTRRNPAILKEGQTGDEMWSFTIVRRDNPSGGERSSVYRYLAPIGADSTRRGEVLRFPAESLPLFPNGNEAYSRPAEFGSLIKLYNYEFKGRSHILMKDGLLSAVGTRLPNPALPMMFHECRDFKGGPGSFSNPFTGLLVRLSDDKAGNIEPEFPHDIAITVAGQPLVVRVFGFKQDRAESYIDRGDGVLFVVNGQTHGKLHSRFYSRNAVKLSYVADSLLAYVDCSGMDRRSQEELFMNTRESLADSEIRKEIEKALEKAFRNDSVLKAFATRRRQEKIQNKLQNDKPLEDTLKNIMRRSPSLASLFLGGTRLSDPFNLKPIAPSEKFVGKFYPTYFRFKGKAEGQVYRRKCELGRTARIKFETDAEHNYFGRSKDRGSYKLTCTMLGSKDEVDILHHGMNLVDGTATLSFELPEVLKVGDAIALQVSVSDDSRADPFRNICELTIVQKVVHPPGPPVPPPPPPSDNPGEGQLAQSSVGLPNAYWVTSDEWQDHGFDKFSALKIMEGPSDSDKQSYDFYVNADNFYLLNELKNSSADEQVTKEQFKVGMVLIGLAIIHDHAKGDEQVEIEKLVFEVSRAISMMMLPIINLLGDLEVETDPIELEAA